MTPGGLIRQSAHRLAISGDFVHKAITTFGSLTTSAVSRPSEPVRAMVCQELVEDCGMRLSIEVAPEEHQRLRAVAALQGKSIEDYVLERVLPVTPTPEQEQALQQLEAFL